MAATHDVKTIEPVCLALSIDCLQSFFIVPANDEAPSLKHRLPAQFCAPSRTYRDIHGAVLLPTRTFTMCENLDSLCHPEPTKSTESLQTSTACDDYLDTCKTMPRKLSENQRLYLTAAENTHASQRRRKFKPSHRVLEQVPCEDEKIFQPPR